MCESQRVGRDDGRQLSSQDGAGRPSHRKYIRRIAHAGVLLGWAATVGCYSYVPVPAAHPGTVASFALTDVGRVALGRQVGEGARKLEGIVESSNDSGYVLRMRSVTYISGERSQWMGERVVVAPQAVNQLQQRRFSTKRTVLFTAAAVGLAVAFVASRDILGSGSERSGPAPNPPEPD